MMPDELVLYHGTSKMFLPDIIERGLQPAWRGQEAVPEAINRETDFTLTTHYETAEYYARVSPFGTGPDPVVLEYHIPRGEASKYLYGGKPQTWDYVAVPPGHKQYAIKNPVPGRFLKAVYEYDSGTGSHYGSGEFTRTPRRRSEVHVRGHRRRA